MAGQAKKKFAIVGVASVILVAMVVAVTIGTQNSDDADTDNYNRQAEVSSSQKAIQTICASTDYKDTCVNSLQSAAGNTSDPKELIEAAFKLTMNYINEAAKNSDLLKELEKDPRTKMALDTCKELAQHAVDDLERTFDKFKTFDLTNIDDLLADMKIWLSGAMTYQETCLDGFEEAPGDAGEKVRESLKTSMEWTSNGLAMINEISSVLTNYEIPNLTNRRLLSDDILGHGFDNFPTWLDGGRRKLLKASPKKIKADLIVAKDGSGKYRTINEAIRHIPQNSSHTFVLYIKEGVYEEKVTFNKSLHHVTVIGDGPTKTRITGNLNFIDGTPTYHTATVVVQGDHFIAKDIGIENTAGPEKHQAVALRVGADKTVFYNCHIDGYQDTLYAHTYRQFYRNCRISGTIDFVFGDSASVFQNCTLVVRKPLDNQQNIITAQGRKEVRQPTGLVLQNCTIVADPAYHPFRFQLKSYLGRPWKEFSRTIIMESFIDDLIQPEGWLAWNETFAFDTLFYAEFNNRGPASNKMLRVKWSGVKELPVSRVKRFLPGKFIYGKSWVPKAKIPYNNGFIYPPPMDDPRIKYSPETPEETKDMGAGKSKAAYGRPDSKSDNKEEAGSPSKSPSHHHHHHHGRHHSRIGLAPALSPVAAPPTHTSASPIKWLFGKFW